MSHSGELMKALGRNVRVFLTPLKVWSQYKKQTVFAVVSFFACGFLFSGVGAAVSMLLVVAIYIAFVLVSSMFDIPFHARQAYLEEMEGSWNYKGNRFFVLKDDAGDFVIRAQEAIPLLQFANIDLRKYPHLMMRIESEKFVLLEKLIEVIQRYQSHDHEFTEKRNQLKRFLEMQVLATERNRLVAGRVLT